MSEIEGSFHTPQHYDKPATVADQILDGTCRLNHQNSERRSEPDNRKRAPYFKRCLLMTTRCTWLVPS